MTNTETLNCPVCFKEYSGTYVKPNPGIHCICRNCASLLKFDHELKLIEVSSNEMRDIDSKLLLTLREDQKKIVQNHFNKKLMKEHPLTWFQERVGKEVDRHAKKEHHFGDNTWNYRLETSISIADHKTAEWLFKTQADKIHNYRYTDNLFT